MCGAMSMPELGVLAYQRRRGLARRAVGDVFGLVGETLGVGGEAKEIVDLFFRVSSHWHDPAIKVKYLASPRE